MSHHPAITISRSLGSGGTEAGFHAARQLGWHFCDRRLLRLAAGAMGQSCASIAREEERASGFKDWLLTILALGTPEATYTPLLEVPVYSKDLFEVQARVMREMVAHAPSVLVGRGGFIALKDRPDTLHVSIHASMAFRVQSLLERGKAPNRKAAEQAIAASDQGRAEFIRTVSGLDWRDPKHFTLVLDPSRDGVLGCAQRMVDEARQRFA